MSELLFALKMAGIAFVLVILMQVRVGDVSIEEHANVWVREAAPILVLREVAEGGLAATHDAWSKLTANIKTKYWNKFDPEKLPGKRQLDIGVERSQAYIEAQNVKRQKVESEMAERAKKVREVIGLNPDGSAPDDVESK